MTDKANRNNRRVTSVTRLHEKRQIRKRYQKIQFVFGSVFVVCLAVLAGIILTRQIADSRQHKLEREMEQTKEETIARNAKRDLNIPTAGIFNLFKEMHDSPASHTGGADAEIKMLPEYEVLYEQNPDMIGWLHIEDTVIDYPVMQTMEDESYYLSYDFNKEANKNGCLIADTDSVVGVGTADNQYRKGTNPSTNLIIHGHTMKSGMMFGGLKKYAEESYGKEHSIISFDSLYEKRKYELIAVFYSKVYMNTDDVFKYYNFFQADTKEEFDDWYENIKDMSLYDTGVSAEFGDEFITLSCCSYHTEDGRFVVVGKRIE